MEENKKLEDFIKKSVKKVGLEKPSIDFTDSVLSKIAVANEKGSVLVTKPLFSQTTWFMILAVMALIFAYVLVGESTTESAWLATIKINKLAYFNLPLNMPKLTYSSTFVYGSTAIVLFVWIQVFLLKQRLNKVYVNN